MKSHKRLPLVPGVYWIRDGIPELGMPEGDYLIIDPPGQKYPYTLMRLLTRPVVEMILASPGVLPIPGGRPPPGKGPPGKRLPLELVA